MFSNTPQFPIKEDMDDPPSLSEVFSAISAMQNNNATGPDGIPAEILKAGGTRIHCVIHALIMETWDKEEIPSDLRDALIVILFRGEDK